MADYYTLVGDCIDFVQDSVKGVHGTRLQLHHHQCRCVSEELYRVRESLQAKGPQTLRARAQDNGMEMLLIHLRAGVKRAQILVGRCCCGNSSWLSTAINLVDIKEEVISILLDLQQWIFMLNNVVVSLRGTCSFKDDDGFLNF